MRFPFSPLLTFFAAAPRSPLAVAQWAAVLLPACLVAGIAASEAALVIIVLCFLAHVIQARDFRWLEESWVKIALLLWCYLMMRGLFDADIPNALRHAMGWLRYVLFGAALAFWVLRDENTRTALLGMLMLAVLFLMADLWFQYLTGHDFFGRILYQTGADARLTGPYSMPRAGIMLSWMSFPLIAWALTNHRLAGVAFVAVILITVIITGDRMPLLNMLLGLVVTLALMPARWQARAAMGAGLIAAGAIVIVTHPALLARQFYSIIDVITHLGATPYGMLWQSAWNIFEAHPWFGAGLHHFRDVCPNEAYGPLTNLALRCNLHPHNTYMEWLSETGIIGFSLFAALVCAWIATAAKGWRDYRGDPVAIGLIAELVIRVWPLSATTSMMANWYAIPLMMVAGWLFASTGRKA